MKKFVRNLTEPRAYIIRQQAAAPSGVGVQPALLRVCALGPDLRG